MPKFLENKLKRQYGAKSKIPYKIMNAIGAMRGNKTTAKGERMQAKHEAKMAKPQIESHAFDWRKRQGGRRKRSSSY